jgi:hypothetical protein
MTADTLNEAPLDIFDIDQRRRCDAVRDDWSWKKINDEIYLEKNNEAARPL